MISKYARTNTRWPIHNFSYIPSLSLSLSLSVSVSVWHFLALSHTPLLFSSLPPSLSLSLCLSLCFPSLLLPFLPWLSVFYRTPVGSARVVVCVCVCVCVCVRVKPVNPIYLVARHVSPRESLRSCFDRSTYFLLFFFHLSHRWLCPTRFVHTGGRKPGKLTACDWHLRNRGSSLPLLVSPGRSCPLITHPTLDRDDYIFNFIFL